MKNTFDANGKLGALIKRQTALAAALRAEREKQKQLEEKSQERLIRIIGRALLANAAQSPDFELMLKGVLRTTPLSVSDRKFLESRDWL